jgi:hypothetical protein
LLAALLALCWLWLPYMPNEAGRLGADYAYFLPSLLAGEFWHVTNGWWWLPWFSPAACGGVPFYANPQGAYLSVPQFLTFAMGPLRAVQSTFLLFAAAGFAGTHHLSRRRFGLSRAASLMAAVLFLLNGFFAARLLVGHLSFAPFMLLPALGSCMLGRPAPAASDGLARETLRCAGFGVITAVMLQAGMAVLMPPAFLSLLILLAMHLLVTGQGPAAPLLRLAAGTATGLVLCAAKLAAVGALMAHLPRDAYPLPGFASLPESAWVAVRALFFRPSPAMRAQLIGTPLHFELHEFTYGVGPVPLILMLAAAWLAWRRRATAPPAKDWRIPLCWAALAALLLVPSALNTVAPVWTPFLKSLPVIGNSSSLLRWFAAYMLPAILGGSIALDQLAGHGLLGGARMAALGMGATVLALLVSDRGFYGAAGAGNYDPARIEESWRAVAASGQAPPITALTMTTDAQGKPEMSQDGQGALVSGLSQINCYEPLFGYFLEAFPRGALHPGSVYEQTADGRLNLKNPACYVFPGANGCKPGDAFRATQLAQAQDFTAWRPYGWARPGWAIAAGWLNLIGGVAVSLAVTVACGSLWFQRGSGSRQSPNRSPTR